MEQFLALKASAGSGKTFALALRFIYLLCQGAKAWEILTLTFTKKAANEMKTRIHNNLRELLSASTQSDLEQNFLFQELQKNGISKEFLTQNIHRIYEEFSTASLKITTIDSFFYTILRKFCWYVGIGSSFIIGDYSDEQIYELFLGSLDASDKREFVKFIDTLDMSFSSFLALLSLNKQVFCYKQTKSITEINNQITKNFYLLKTEILKIPNITPRVQKLLQKEPKPQVLLTEKWIFEFEEHSFLKKFAKDLESLHPLQHELQQLLYEFVVAKEELVFGQITQYSAKYEYFKNRILRQNNILRFDDVTEKNHELLVKSIDRDFFYFRLDDRIMHILLDEFQDTSILQYKILKPLIDEVCGGDGRIGERSVFIVGDKKQSIYSFRGGFASVFEEAAKSLKSDNLPYNYRSEGNIVEFINKTFTPQYEDYKPQKLPDNSLYNKGYVSVREVNGTFEEVYMTLCELIDSNIPSDKIAILLSKNNEVQALSDFIKSQKRTFKLVTESSSNFFARFPCNVLINLLHFTHTNNTLFLLNAKKQLGLLSTSVLELPKFDGDLARYVFMLIESLEIGGVLSAKFLECVCKFESLETFLQEYTTLQIPTPVQNLSGVKIMTIHKSKGLEFEHLIVCDNFQQKRNTQPKFIYEYDGVDCVKVYYNIAGRENVDISYARAKRQMQELEQNEELNRLYVAFTRARKSLIVLKKKEKSRFESLRLHTQEFGQLQECTTPSQQPQDKLQESSICIRLPKLGVQKDFIQDEHVESGFDSFSLSAITYGKALHTCFEYFLHAKEKSVELESILENLYGFILNKTQRDSVKKTFDRASQSSEFQALLAQGSVYTEVSFLLNGEMFRIDTLIVSDACCYVLDYKSTSLDKKQHQQQVQGYMKFVQNLFAKKTFGYLIYPNGEQICVQVNL